MKNAPYLTKAHNDVLVQQINGTVAGMAHFSNTGPFNTRCSGCRHYGYWKQFYNRVGEVVATQFRPRACGKYHELTKQHGPALRGDPVSCRHYQEKTKSEW